MNENYTLEEAEKRLESLKKIHNNVDGDGDHMYLSISGCIRIAREIKELEKFISEREEND